MGEAEGGERRGRGRREVGRRERLWAKLGGPFVERELGPYPLRWSLVGAALALLLVLVNAGAYGTYWLESLDPWAWMSSAETAYLRGGWSSWGTVLDLQVLGLLAMFLFVGAPSMAAQTILRESNARTMDNLLLTPLSPMSLHAGFVLGALAKLLPWWGPLLALHLFLGASFAVSPLVVFGTSVALLVGGLGLASFGAALGLLLRRSQLGLMGGMAVTSLLGLLVGLPLFALFDAQAAPLSALSPASAILNAVLSSPNAWVEAMGPNLRAVYEGRILGLPIEPLAQSSVFMALLGLLGAHISARRLSDPLAPVVDRRVALATGVALTGLSLQPVAMSLPQLVPSWMGPGLGEWLGEQVMFSSFSVSVVAWPWVVLLMFGVLPSGAFLERAALWAATRPRDMGARQAEGSPLPWMVALALVPVLGSAALPFLASGLPASLSTLEVGLGFLWVVPWAWSWVLNFSIFAVWRMSARKVWQTSLAVAGVFGALILASIYSAITIDRGGPDLWRWAGSPDGEVMVFGVPALLLFLSAPLGLIVWALARRASFGERVKRLVAKVSREEAPKRSFSWPEGKPVVGEVLCQLRAPLSALKGGVSSWLTGARTMEEAAHEAWLRLEEGALWAWEGSVKEPGQGARRIDLTRPFALTVSREPRAAEDSMETVHLSLAQKQGEGADEVVKVAFSVPVQASPALEVVPVQAQRLERLAPRDAEPVLAAIRYHAEANGVMLPL